MSEKNEVKTEAGQCQTGNDSGEARVMSKPDQADVDALIRKRVYAAIGVGMAPVPLLDLVGLTAIQIEMIHALAQQYGVEFKKERVKSIISSLCGSALSVATVPFFASLFKSLPLIGSTAGATTVCIVGGASTYALGQVFDRHFREGGDLINFNADDTKAYFKSKMEEGKDLVSKMKPGKAKSKAEPQAEASEKPADQPA